MSRESPEMVPSVASVQTSSPIVMVSYPFSDLPPVDYPEPSSLQQERVSEPSLPVVPSEEMGFSMFSGTQPFLSGQRWDTTGGFHRRQLS